MQFRASRYWVAYRAPSADEADAWMNVGLLPRAPLPRLEHRYVSAVHPERGAITTFGREAMTDIAQAAMPGVPVQDSVWLEEYDGYYYDPRGSRPLPVLRVRYADANATWLYLDPERGGIVQRSGNGEPAAALAVSGLPQPRLSVPVLPASAVGHRRHRPEHRRHRPEFHDDVAGDATLRRHGRAVMAWRPLKKFVQPRVIAERAN